MPEGLEGVGRRYLQALGATSKNAENDRIVRLVWSGEGLTDAEHLALVLEAVDSATTDGDLWLIADGPIEEGLLPRRTAGQTLLELRQRSPKLQRLWQVMRQTYADEGQDPGPYWTA